MRKLTPQAPQWAIRFLHFYCRDTLVEEIEGDLVEEFNERLEKMAVWKARLIFYWQVLSFLRPFAIKQFSSPDLSNSRTMFFHYLKVALRNFSRQILAVTINVLSLTLGIGCLTLIYLFIQNEWSYDQFHDKGDQIYRINRVVYDGQGLIVDGIEGHPVPMAQALKETYPEVLDVCRVHNTQENIKYGGFLEEEHIYYVDSNFFEMFSFPFITGDPQSALKNRDGAVITERLAKKLFGKSKAIGETISIFVDDGFQPFQINGVVQDLPANSTLQFDVALPFHYIENHGFVSRYKDTWGMSFVRNFALLPPEVDLPTLQEKTIAFCDQYFPRRRSIHERYGEDSYYGEVFQPIKEVHFDDFIESDLGENGKQRHAYILGGIGAGILLLACINFTILAIGRSSRRFKEIGVRKVVGARPQQLAYQFLGESILISCLGLALGLAFAYTFLPQFNELSNRSIAFSSLLTTEAMLFLLGTVLLTGLLAGIYPALFLSRYKPAKTIVNNLRLGSTNLFTKVLVTIQFVLSIVLVLFTLVMLAQLRFMKERDLGFKEEALVVVQRQGLSKDKFFSTYKNEFSNDPQVEALTATNPAFTHGGFSSNFEYQGNTIDYFITFIETNYLETMGIELNAGRNFRAGSTLDSTQHILVNQAFVDALGWDDPIGRKVEGLNNAGYDEPVIIGVTNNFHFQSLEHAVLPMWMALSDEDSMDDLVVQIASDDINEVIRKMEKTWTVLGNENPFNYSFLDEDMAALYKSEERWSKIIKFSGGFAALIAFMGMYGLMALSLVGRAREMSIRKVLGASTGSLINTLSGPFARLVVIAIVIALPIAWYLTIGWLDNFAYQVPLRFGIVLLGFAIIWALFFVSIIYHIWRSARLNPIEFLRSE